MPRQTIVVAQRHAVKVLAAVDAGLCVGLGKPTLGRMCLESATFFGLGLPHGDSDCRATPKTLRKFKLAINDANWSTNMTRAAGLRRLALVSLGCACCFDANDFSCRVTDIAVRHFVSKALGAIASAMDGDLDFEFRRCLAQGAADCSNRPSVYTARAAMTAAKQARTWTLWSNETKAEIALYASKAAASAAIALDDRASTGRKAVQAVKAVIASAKAVAVASPRLQRNGVVDDMLAEFVSQVVDMMANDMLLPGRQWLHLTDSPWLSYASRPSEKRPANTVRRDRRLASDALARVSRRRRHPVCPADCGCIRHTTVVSTTCHHFYCRS